ncbi:MAG: SusD/RagB family nutrient-binding outer membrane lipoprotein, partial [Bacteroidota bacterium]
VPYTEAFHGTSNQTPKYDNASAIYDSLYEQLTLGINNLNAATSLDFPDATSDIMFKGNKALWIKLANTLKLKLLIRQSAVTAKAGYIQAKLADFNNDLTVFLQAKDIAQINPGYTNSTNQQNPFWVNFGYSLTNTIAQGSNADVYNGGLPALNYFCNSNDLRVQRLMDYTSYNGTGTLAGVDQNFYNFVSNNTLGVAFIYAGTEMGAAAKAATGTTLPTTFSTIANNPTTTLLPIKSASSNALIFSDFESLFLQAEAVQRGWFSGGDAGQLFSDGMAQSFSYDFDIALTKGRLPLGQFGVTSTTIMGELVTSADNDWATAQGVGQELQAILTQKYMALGTYNFLEPWTEYRRTGFPKVDNVNFPLISTSANGHPIPYRYLYPQREYSVNSANVPKQAINAQFNSKLFWMP